jgi:hypothetical protein
MQPWVFRSSGISPIPWPIATVGFLILHGLASDFDCALRYGFDSEDQLCQFGSTSSDQSGKAKDFSFTDLEADSGNSVARHIFQFKHYFARFIYLYRKCFLQWTVDHQLDQFLTVGIMHHFCLYQLAIPQYGYPVGQFKTSSSLWEI